MLDREEQAKNQSEAFARRIAHLREMHPSDIADEIDGLELDEIRAVLRELSDETVAEILPELSSENQTQLLENMRLERLTEIIPEMYTDDVADALSKVSPDRLQDIMDTLETQEAKELTNLLDYPEDTAGGIMQKEVLAVRTSLTLGQAREAIRKDEEQDEDSALYVYAVDDNDRLQGVLRLRDLLFRDLRLKVGEVMDPDVRSISVNADQEEIANIFRRYNYIALPVIDDFGKLVGLVTSDDVFDVIQEEATEDMQRMIGMSGEEGVNTSWTTSFRQRTPWLGLNLGTAFLSASVIALFEGTLKTYTTLAALLPIVASLGGNTGNQALTIMVRSLALGEIEGREWRNVLGKELLVGICNGLLIGSVAGVISWLWKGSWVIGTVVCLAMILNMIAAALAGIMVPIGLRAAKVDPALASSIMVTTVTDVLGFFIFLSLATGAFKLLPL